MSSASNRDAISNVKWLADNETLAFLGQNQGNHSQVFVFNVRTKGLDQLTHHADPILAYDISTDGREVAYVASSVTKNDIAAERISREGIVISDQSLAELLSEKGDKSEGAELFVQQRTGPPSAIRVEYSIASGLLSISPDGRYAVLGADVSSKELPAYWGDG